MVVVTQYKWGGRWGLFSIRSKCSECDLTTAYLEKMMKDHFTGRPVTFEIRPWLDNWWYCLKRGAWHAPIIMVNGRRFYQFSEKRPLFDKQKLIAHIQGQLGT